MALSADQAIGQALGAVGTPGATGLSRQQLQQLGYSDAAITQAIQIFGPNITQQGMRLLQDEIDRRQALTSDPHQALTDLYEEYLGRMPDPSGLATYLGELQRGVGLDTVRQEIANSPEARQHNFVDRSWDPTGMAGIGPPELGNMSQQDWSKLLDTAEAFAANTGWENMPSAVDLYNLYRTGQWMDQQYAFQFFAQHSLSQDQQSRMPWAASGLSAQAYHQRRDQYLDSIETYTGTRDVPDQSIINQALTEGWSSQRLLDHFLNDSAFQSQYGWVKYGYTYQGFQNYKLQQRQHIVTRYGQSAANADSAYLSDLANPLQSVAASSGPIRQQNQAQTTGGSEVR